VSTEPADIRPSPKWLGSAKAALTREGINVLDEAAKTD